MAGGAGTRLWPLSRDSKPKQFHPLSGRGTLLGETILRLKSVSPDRYVIVTARKYEDLTSDEIKLNNVKGTILSEPVPRNTAAAVLYAAVYLDKLFTEDSIMVVLPADHHIRNSEEFTKVLQLGIQEAKKDQLVTIGIDPDYPETGYGYIKSNGDRDSEILHVEKFVEKPDLATARGYLSEGGYFWNSGIFVWKTSAILRAFDELMSNHVKAFAPLQKMTHETIESTDPHVWEIKQQVFNSLESVSIDYGILENATNRIMIPARIGWADLGSWKAIDDILDPDSNGNRTPSPDRAIFVKSSNCSVYTEGRRVSIVGLSDVVVVETDDEILVINKDASQDVRAVVDIVKKRG